MKGVCAVWYRPTDTDKDAAIGNNVDAGKP